MTTSAERARLGAIPLAPLDEDAALAWILDRARGDAPLGIVATVNMNFLTLARSDAAFARVLGERTALNLVDGRPVAWLLGVRGVRGAARAAGSDLTASLLRHAAMRELGVFLLGDTADTLAAVQARGAAEGWGTSIRGVLSPSRADVDDREASARLVSAINASGARVLLVAFGAPRQELWLDRWRDDLRPRVGIGIGGSLKFVGGVMPRAPRWMQRAGLEWLHRSLTEPRRLVPRYARDFIELARQLAGIARQNGRETT
jgi:N-acetylglucosaminyldiphosphoundecaprenol N-acetyl-beta-D-mannosaminyltransferase